MFETLHINVPFAEVLDQMPHYAKFLKEFPTNKRKLEEVPSVTLSKECSAILTNKLLKKKKDLEGFIIPCTIGEFVNNKALTILGQVSTSYLTKFFRNLGLES